MTYDIGQSAGRGPVLAALGSPWRTIVEGHARSRNSTPHINRQTGVLGPVAMTSAPTLSMLATKPVPNTIGSNAPVAPGMHYFTGGRLKVHATNGYRFPVTTIGGAGGNVGDGENAVVFRVKCIIDAVDPVFQILSSTVAYRVLVREDGQMRYADVVGAAAPNGGYSNFLQVTFADRRPREIWLESEQAAAFQAVHVRPTETVTAAPAGRRLTVFGDSLVAGTSSGTANFRAGDGFAIVMGEALGFDDIRCSGNGGEGVLDPASSGSLFKFRDRITADAVDSHAIAICYGTNDASFSTNALRDELVLGLQQLRASFPACPIMVFGSPGNSTGPNAATLTVEAGYAAAVAQLADPAIIHVPVSNPSGGARAMLYGTGRQGATNASGNSDIYVGTDAVHWNAAGHAYCGFWMADAAVAAITAAGF